MSRKQLHEITIDATPEEVWRCLTEADQITRWFAPEAKVEPGVGGKVLLSWGPGMEGESPIHLWEPNHRFGWTEQGARPKLVEFEIEAKDGVTILRLVQSGFGEGASFEDEFEATNGGWRTYFRILKFGLEHHLGETCTPVSVFRQLDMTRDQITPRLSLALDIQPALEDLREGQSYKSNLDIRGTRLEPDKPGYYLLTVDNWSNSLFALFTEKMGDKCFFTLQAYLFGDAGKRADQVRQIFTDVQL
jgi:uncharacterized protein YndB with AHSA1/START domain